MEPSGKVSLSHDDDVARVAARYLSPDKVLWLLKRLVGGSGGPAPAEVRARQTRDNAGGGAGGVNSKIFRVL